MEDCQPVRVDGGARRSACRDQLGDPAALPFRSRRIAEAESGSTMHLSSPRRVRGKAEGRTTDSD